MKPDAAGGTMDIADWRRKIDELDRELVRLLNERARCAAEIGKLKHQNGLPILEPRREQEVLQHALEANAGPLDHEALRRVFRQIVEEMRRLEQQLVDQRRAAT
jgi:chorismate mutase-like protein